MKRDHIEVGTGRTAQDRGSRSRGGGNPAGRHRGTPIHPGLPRAENAGLCALAKLHGIQTAYVDMAGQRQEACPETLQTLLDALGIPASSSREVFDSLRNTRLAQRRQCLEPILVAWDGKPLKLSLRLSQREAERPFDCRLCLQDGTQLTLHAKSSRTLSAAPVDGQAMVIRELRLPQLPAGYHHFHYSTAAGECESMILAAPAACYTEPGTRAWGAFLPTYALHSRNSWGAGNWSDWERLVDWIASLGGTVVGTLPQMASFLSPPKVEPSPYSPASRLFWNEFYLDIEAIPDLANCPEARQLIQSGPFQRRLAAFRASEQIDYPAQARLRRQALELLAECFFKRRDPARWQAFRQFTCERPDVEDYARFRAACERTGAGWPAWAEPARNGKLTSADYDERQFHYHLYAQWQAHAQMAALTARCQGLGVKFYLDMPLGVNPDSYDMWRHRDTFASRARVGSPPDPFFTKGQDWGFAPPHPRRIREQGYRHFRDVLAFQMRHTGLLRIDHVMALHRLYWIGPGCAARNGAYVQYRADEHYAVLSLESHRHQTMVVGENLGTVPPEVDQSIRRHRVRGMYVIQYAATPKPEEALPAPSLPTVASLNTHDMPPWKMFWDGADIDDRHALGLIPDKQLRSTHAERRKLVAAIAAFLRRKGYLTARQSGSEEALTACLRWLADSPAELVLVNLEDLWGEARPQNVPGTCTERPNWKRKTRLPLSDIQGTRAVQDLLRELTGRRKPQGSKRRAK